MEIKPEYQEIIIMKIINVETYGFNYKLKVNVNFWKIKSKFCLILELIN